MHAMDSTSAKPASSKTKGVDAQYKPLVTIITPIWNRIKFLESSIRCIQNQTYTNIEHIFADGGSTDGTLEALAEYQAKYPGRIRYITGKDNGVGDAARKGFKISKGEIISWIDSDDLYEPDAVETIVKFFRDTPDAYFVYGDCNLLDENGKASACFIIKDFDLKEALNIWHYLIIPAVFYKREVIEKLGYLNDLGNDLDFYIRVYKNYKMHRIRKVLGGWRAHGASISFGTDARAYKIRLDRAWQDFYLILRYGGSLRSPKAMAYYSSRYYRFLASPTGIKVQPYLNALQRLKTSIIRRWKSYST